MSRRFEGKVVLLTGVERQLSLGDVTESTLDVPLDPGAKGIALKVGRVPVERRRLLDVLPVERPVQLHSRIARQAVRQPAVGEVPLVVIRQFAETDVGVER